MWHDTRVLKFGFALALLTPMAASAAPSVFDKYLAGSKHCYERNHDAAHMAAHPRQTVRGIEVNFDPKDPDGKPNIATAFQLGFSFQLKKSHEWFGDAAYCKTVTDHFECYLDADGGLFRLTPQGDGLFLTVTGDANTSGEPINVEGMTDFVSFGKQGGDDRSFLLPPADAKACDTIH